jgi:hypothetical protein
MRRGRGRADGQDYRKPATGKVIMVLASIGRETSSAYAGLARTLAPSRRTGYAR